METTNENSENGKSLLPEKGNNPGDLSSDGAREVTGKKRIAESPDEDDPDEEEEDESRPNCVYCDSEYCCEHILYDTEGCLPSSFGGTDEICEIGSTLLDAFLTLPKKKIRLGKKDRTINPALLELWNEFVTTCKQRPEDPWLDSCCYFGLVEHIVETDIPSSEVYTDHYYSGGSAGSGEYAMSICFAADPAKVIEMIREKFPHYLAPLLSYIEAQTGPETSATQRSRPGQTDKKRNHC